MGNRRAIVKKVRSLNFGNFLHIKRADKHYIQRDLSRAIIKKGDMIKVVVGNNVKRESVLISSDSTLREALESGNVDYSNGVMHLDGSSISPGDLNKTFVELGYDGSEGRDKCFLLNVVKADNAR